jgi:predicted CoA-binding protein
MKTLSELVSDFLSQPSIAVVGISSSKRTVANGIYKKFKEGNRTVFAVGRNTSTYDGSPCYRDLASLPNHVDGVFAAVTPEQTEAVVRECISLHIPRVWMHCMGGIQRGPSLNYGSTSTSVSARAVQMCREHNIAVIPGACPMMFLDDADFFHSFLRRLHRVTGKLRIDAD